ncbi:MAG: hypothetical protein LBU45_05920 [Azoarcus sp.]|jgi:hypothetical protein|nr:hypothetical protein [Azoarcus sp.]
MTRFSLFVPGSTLWQFGIAGTNYVGPGCTAGQLGGKTDYSNPMPLPTCAVDEAAARHDMAYDYSSTPNLDILKADIVLEHDMSNLLCNGELSHQETMLAKAIQGIFAIKIAIYDISLTISEATGHTSQIEVVGSHWDMGPG